VAPPEGAAEGEHAAATAAAQEKDEEAAECAICHASVYEAGVECGCCPGRFTCTRHADALCECPPARWRLAFRHSLGELAELLEQVRARVLEGKSPPHVWT
jgi:histone demethylase JARID1